MTRGEQANCHILRRSSVQSWGKSGKVDEEVVGILGDAITRSSENREELLIWWRVV